MLVSFAKRLNSNLVKSADKVPADIGKVVAQGKRIVE